MSFDVSAYILDCTAGFKDSVVVMAVEVLIDLVLLALHCGGPGLVACVALVLEVVHSVHVFVPSDL